MANYIIADIQGCLTALQQLLDQINFNEQQDHLHFVGDLVNRGPESLPTLRFIRSLKNASTVLGNHDLHLLALTTDTANKPSNQLLQPIINAPDCTELLDWLRQQPLIYQHPSQHYVIVHAGIPPQWSIAEAIQYATEVQKQLTSDNYQSVLNQLYGDQPAKWQSSLTGYDRLRYIVNALTRMRFCTQQGELELTNKTNESPDPTHYQPWFHWRNTTTDIYFGHWASLQGQCDAAHIFALDTGYTWGGSLTAIRVEDKKIFRIKNPGAN